MSLVPLKNCHYPGLDSIPIGKGMRIYRANERIPDFHMHCGIDDPFPIAPHQHAYDIELIGLWGVMHNHIFRERKLRGLWTSERNCYHLGEIRTPLRDVHRIGVGRVLTRHENGCWFEVWRTKRAPLLDRYRYRDPHTFSMNQFPDLTLVLGGYGQITQEMTGWELGWRQLSKKELRRYNLENK